ncbi:hypothetical protein [Kitasatospora sp. NPDC002040]|uniref:hypothetical protein n=1 Tax=Kitasatospora sp. NPDC002040 TaxID=3154661 RepID=UPI00332CF556
MDRDELVAVAASIRTRRGEISADLAELPAGCQEWYAQAEFLSAVDTLLAGLARQLTTP